MAEAAADLGIELERMDDAVIVRGFGTSLGMLCAVRKPGDESETVRRFAEQHGMAWSALGPSYLTYRRGLFVETLNDWGWVGEQEPPTWYTGEPWTA